MQDFREKMTIDISGKTHSAMIAFLKKHGEDSHNLSAFIEEAITWRIIDRELAFQHGAPRHEESLAAEIDDEHVQADLLAGQMRAENRRAA